MESYIVAMIRHHYKKRPGERSYLFRVPTGMQLNMNDEIVCETRRGIRRGWVDSPVFSATDDWKELYDTLGSTLPLNFIKRRKHKK